MTFLSLTSPCEWAYVADCMILISSKLIFSFIDVNNLRSITQTRYGVTTHSSSMQWWSQLKLTVIKIISFAIYCSTTFSANLSTKQFSVLISKIRYENGPPTLGTRSNLWVALIFDAIWMKILSTILKSSLYFLNHQSTWTISGGNSSYIYIFARSIDV